MRRNSVYSASGQKTWQRHLLRQPRFLIRRGIFPLSHDVFGIYLMFLCTIFIWPCDLDLRPFDHVGVWRIKSLTRPTHLPFLSFLRLSVPELCVTQSDHITIAWNCHCACAVSCDLSPGTKMIHIFEIPHPNLPIHFVTFRELRRSLSHIICENSNFIPLSRLQSSLRMRSITWPVYRGPPKPHVTIFWPRLIYSLYNFYGATVGTVRTRRKQCRAKRVCLADYDVASGSVGAWYCSDSAERRSNRTMSNQVKQRCIIQDIHLFTSIYNT